MQKSVAILVPVLAFLALAAPAAQAAQAGPIVVIYDKAQVLHLKEPARRVIVANPNIADVSVEEPTMLYIFGKAPGETSVTVLGNDDHVLLSRPVVVTVEPDRQVTVHGPAVAEGGPVSRQYSCVSDRCLKVASPEAQATAAIAPAAAPGGGANTGPGPTENPQPSTGAVPGATR